MDKKELLDIYNEPNYSYVLQEFKRLCSKAQELMFDYLIFKRDDSIGEMLGYNMINPELTPIEQIFNIAYYTYFAEIFKFVQFKDIDNKLPVPLLVIFIEEICQQENIQCNNRTYRGDFVLDLSRLNINNEYIYPELKSLKYVIELDGFEYHSNKKQMNCDYEREVDLQALGYKVVRFTGSQVYKEPYTCVDKFVNIVLNDMRRELKDE